MHDILIIEDDPKIAAALKVRFRAAGMTTRHAETGEMGLEMARDQCPNLIIQDIRLPGINGITVCKTIKAEPRTAACSVVFLSAETSEATRTAAISAGGHCFINKPYNASELVRKVQAAIS